MLFDATRLSSPGLGILHQRFFLVAFFFFIFAIMAAGIFLAPFFIAGFSNGGQMAYKLNCELSQLFAGVATNGMPAGAAGTPGLGGCQPQPEALLTSSHAASGLELTTLSCVRKKPLPPS